MPAGSRIEGGSIRAGVLMFVAGLALALCAVQILHQEATRPHERFGEIVADKAVKLGVDGVVAVYDRVQPVGVAINYQQ